MYRVYDPVAKVFFNANGATVKTKEDAQQYKTFVEASRIVTKIGRGNSAYIQAV